MLQIASKHDGSFSVAWREPRARTVIGPITYDEKGRRSRAVHQHEGGHDSAIVQVRWAVSTGVGDGRRAAGGAGPRREANRRDLSRSE